MKDVLNGLMIAGAISIAATSPYFLLNLSKGIKKWLKNKKYQNKKIYDTFYRLKKEGLVYFEKKGKQIYIRLTEKGKKKAGWFQIDALEIKKPKRWDKKYRLVIFDISEMKRIYREVFRGKLKELGFYPLQKSVWVCPYDCQDEIELLRDFFGLSQKELKFIVAEKIEKDDEIKQFFGLK